MKIAISGGPKVGKTTLATKLQSLHGGALMHGDDLIGTHAWSEASEKLSTYFDLPIDAIIEGVQVPRALRKWLAKNPKGKPCDIVYHSSTPRMELSKGQASMLKGCQTVWNEIFPQLVTRGVDIRTFPKQ